MKSFKIQFYLSKISSGVGLNNYSFSHDNFINYVETKYILTKFLNIQDGANNFNKICRIWDFQPFLWVFNVSFLC